MAVMDSSNISLSNIAWIFHKAKVEWNPYANPTEWNVTSIHRRNVSCFYVMMYALGLQVVQLIIFSLQHTQTLLF